MSRELVYHPKVPAEAREFLTYYLAISSDLGEAFWKELLEGLEEIRLHPKKQHFDRLGLRRHNLQRFPIHLLFRVLSGSIRITAIRHDRQNPSYGSCRQ